MYFMKVRFLQPAILFLIGFCVMIMVVASCSKGNPSGSDSVCINRISAKVGIDTLSAIELDSIYALFSVNHLSVANLQFQSWITDTTVNILPNQYSGYQEEVVATQFINGLPVFSNNEVFVFDAGKLAPGGIVGGYTGPVPSGDTSGHQSATDLRNAFLAHVSESFISGGPANSKPFVPQASTYENVCLDITLGYIDAGSLPGNTTTLNHALIKVWYITPSSNAMISYYPRVYVEDDNGKAWGWPLYLI